MGVFDNKHLCQKTMLKNMVAEALYRFWMRTQFDRQNVALKNPWT